MSNVVRPTVWQENAALAATRDRGHQAELVVAVARQEALMLIVDGKPGEALYRLTRACLSAGRILGATA